MRLENKVAMITGAAAGLGLATAHKFAQEGAKVVIVDLTEELVKRAEKEITDKSGIAFGIVGDVTSNVAMKDVVAKVVEKFGTVDILVNNAGVTRDAMSYKMTEAQWDTVIAINLKGPFNCAQAVIPTMREKMYGKIINISSAARFGNIGQANYSSSKEGLVGMTRTLAKELASKNINVNCVAPGFIESEMSSKVPEDIFKGLIKNIPMLRQGTMEEIANVCLFFASDESSYVTGQVLDVGGGRHMP